MQADRLIDMNDSVGSRGDQRDPNPDPCAELSPETVRALFQVSECFSDDFFSAPDPPEEIASWLQAATREQLCGIVKAAFQRLS